MSIPDKDTGANSASSKSAALDSAPETEPAQPDLGLEEDEEVTIGEFYEEGSKLALICFDEGPQRDSLAKIMTDLGYVPVLPKSTRDVLRRIKVTMFHAILLHENFNGHSGGLHPILVTLQPMNMSTRRRIFFAFFGNNFQSLDYMTAFQLSVNAVIALSDESRFDKIIHKALADYERFYAVYLEVAREAGRG